MNEAIPKELLVNRDLIDANVVLSMFKQPDLIYDYPISMKDGEEDIVDLQARTLYSIAYNMIVKHKYESIDKISLASFIHGKKGLEKFIEGIGLEELMKAVSVVNAKNIEAFYESLLRSNLLIKLHKTGLFNIVGNIEKLNKMDKDQISDYFSYKLDDSFDDLTLNTSKISDMFIGEEEIDSILQGEDVGLSFHKQSPKLNMTLNGITKGNFHILSSYSGNGKSTFVMDQFLIPFAEQGIKCCLISNELSKKQFLQLLISIVATRKFKYYELTRERIRTGNLTKEMRVKFDEVVVYINENIAKNIKFVEMFQYDIGSVKKIINKLSKINFDFFCYDTFKSDNVTDDKNWQTLIELSKQLFMLAKKNNVVIYATVQLTINTKGNMRYLTSSALSQSKSIAEVCHSILLMREIQQDEKSGEKFDIAPYNVQKDESGKYTKKIKFQYDDDYVYQIVFVEKNRSGKSNVQILYSFDGSHGVFYEKAWCSVKQ